MKYFIFILRLKFFGLSFEYVYVWICTANFAIVLRSGRVNESSDKVSISRECMINIQNRMDIQNHGSSVAEIVGNVVVAVAAVVGIPIG